MMTERERFESWAIKQPRGFDMRHGRRSSKRTAYRSPTTQAAWEAWQARCPEGYKCVPVEPTEEMVDAASATYIPFGDMALAIQAAIVYAPGGESDQ